MMTIRKSRSVRLCLVAIAGLLVTTGCGLSQSTALSTVKGAGIKPIDGLKGVTLTVGSKEYAEQIILSQIAIGALQAAGAKPVDKTGLQGTGTVRTALESGQIDLYWEYTASAWFDSLKQTKAPAGSLFAAVAKKDLASNRIVWLPAAPLNDTYAIAIGQAFAKQSGITTMSQMAQYLASHPDSGTLCDETEFNQRADGLSGMEAAYGMKDLKPEVMGVAVVYDQVAAGKVCNFGEIYSTDGRIVSLKLTVLKDDKSYFSAYNAAPIVRLDTAQKYPELKGLLAPIAAKLDTATMTKLNAEAAAGESPRNVALGWLRSEGFIA